MDFPRYQNCQLGNPGKWQKWSTSENCVVNVIIKSWLTLYVWMLQNCCCLISFSRYSVLLLCFSDDWNAAAFAFAFFLLVWRLSAFWAKYTNARLAAGKTANMQKGKYWGLVKSYSWKSLSCISFTKLPLVTEWWRHKDWSQFQSFLSHFLDEIHRIDAWGKAQYVNRSWCLVGSGVEQEVELRARLCWRGWICG